MEKTEIRRFGYSLERANGTMDFVISRSEWTEENHEELERLTSVIFAVQPLTIAHGILEANFGELERSIVQLGESLNLSKAQVSSAVSIGLAGFVDLIQRCTNFLASASAFLTQCQIRLGRLLGTDSLDYKTWDSKRKSLHASSFTYRFLYELRNFSQHSSLPISSLGMSATRNNADERMVFTLKIAMSRDELLRSGYKWNKLEVEIAEQPQEFELMPHINQYMRQLRTLSLSAFRIFELRLAETEGYFSAINRVFKIPENAIPAVYIFTPPQTLGPPTRQEPIPIEQFAHIRRCVHTLTNIMDKLDN